jgi:hypothetical protein
MESSAELPVVGPTYNNNKKETHSLVNSNMLNSMETQRKHIL